MKKIIVLISMLALLLLAACETRIVMPEDKQYNTLSVSGSSEFDVAPDEATIRIRIDTRDKTAQQAQDQNKQVANSVRSAIRNLGVRDKEVETVEYNVRRWSEWDGKLKRTVDKGYQVYNVFKITTTNLESIGDILDAAVQAGASVDSINFGLSDRLMSEVRTEALQKAGANANEKAEALASGMGVRLVHVRSISEGSVNYMPIARGYADMAVATMEKATPIEPRSVTMNAQVSVSYEIG